VNLINRLFRKRPAAQPEGLTTHTWTGSSGSQYSYEIHPLSDSFRPLPANYIYAGKSEDGQWVPLYVAQTRDLNQRLEGTGKMDDAVSHGATHIHVHISTAGQAARCTEERDLIARWHPVCNVSAES